MYMVTKRLVLLLIFVFSIQVCLPPEVSAANDKKKQEELKKKLEELRKKKALLQQKTQQKIKKKTKQPSQSSNEIIVKYEKLEKSLCAGKRYKDRCADVMYSLSKLYYEKAQDDYIKARAKYEKDMDKWERNPEGPEPLNPIPDYTQSLEKYQQSVKLFPKFEKADEAYFQIGNILTLHGDLDGAKDSFLKLVVTHPRSIRASAAHFRLMEFCYMDRDWTCALKHIEKIKRNQVNPEVQEKAHFRKAEIFYNRAEFDKAADLFFTYVEKCDKGEYPKKDLRDDALEYLAISFSDMPNGGKEAIKYFKKHGRRPWENIVIYTVGRKNFEHGQYDQAVLALQTALESFPFDKEAPVSQQMITNCRVVRKKYDLANDDREKLVDRYSKGTEWYNRNSNDPVALEKANNEVKKALASIPIYYHSEAQKKKSKELYEKAIHRYKQYVTMFPNEKWKVYEFKYYMAEIYNSLHDYENASGYYDFVAKEDLKTYPVFQMDLDTFGMDPEEIEKEKLKRKKTSPVSISQEDAGYNAIVTLDNLRKKKMQAQNISDEQAFTLPETQRFVDYISTFYQRFPRSSNSPEVLYLAGNVYYLAKVYDKAIVEFKKIIANFSRTKFANKSLRMLANTHAAAGNTQAALKTYKRAIKYEKPNTQGYTEVVDLAAGTIFKSATTLKGEGKLKAAAKTYKSINAQYPTSKVADRGWFEAGVCLEEAKALTAAAETFRLLGNKFPKSKLLEKSYVRSAENFKKLSKWKKAGEVFEIAANKIPKAEYAIPSLSAAADNYGKAKMFAKAGQMYEQILHKYPTDKQTAQAIYNGGLIYEKGKMYEKAIDLYTTLGAKYPESEFAPEGYYAIGFCYEKMGKDLQMARAFSDFAEKFTANRAKQVSALMKASDSYMKLKNPKLGEKNAQLAIAVFEKYRDKAKIELSLVSKAYYRIGEMRQKDFDKIPLKGRNSKQVNSMVKKKTKALEPVLKAYTKAIELGVGEWTIRSTYQIAKCFVDFADAFRRQTLFGNKSQKTASQIRIIQGLEKYYIKAMEKFHWNINTAWKQNIKNKWVDKSKEEYSRFAYKTGYLFEEIGLIFKKAPIPRGMSKEEKQAYNDVLEEKYLEALDAALPKYEAGFYAVKELGIAKSKWVDSLKARISFINPSSKVLEETITEREPYTGAPEEITAPPAGTPPASSPSSSFELEEGLGGDIAANMTENDNIENENDETDRSLSRALKRIDNIVAMKIPTSEKIAQLQTIENDALREIQKEEETIEEYKQKLGIN